MATTVERLSRILLKTERAHKHIRDLKDAVNTCYAENAYSVAGKLDPKTKKVIYYVAVEPQIPTPITLITGDIFHNLRTALDHLAWQLVIAAGNQPFEGSTGFPICDSATFYKSTFSGQVKGMDETVIDALRAMQMHENGRGHSFWQLHRIDKIDKHRLLIPVASRVKALNIGRHWEQTLIPEPIQLVDLADLWVAPKIPGPLQKGSIVFTDTKSGKVNEDIQITFEIALHEPGVVDCQPLIEFVEGLYNLVDKIICDFSASL
jgi:hypothetical protein